MTRFSNYAIRVLMYTGIRSEQPSSVPEIARAYDISYDHLKKAASELCRLGYLQAVRGRGGGLLLARDPVDISLGQIIRLTEGDVVLVECFDETTNTCPLASVCVLRQVLTEALNAFFAVLDRYTLADLIRDPGSLERVLGLQRHDPYVPPRLSCGLGSD